MKFSTTQDSAIIDISDETMYQITRPTVHIKDNLFRFDCGIAMIMILLAFIETTIITLGIYLIIRLK